MRNGRHSNNQIKHPWNWTEEVSAPSLRPVKSQLLVSDENNRAQQHSGLVVHERAKLDINIAGLSENKAAW